MGPTASLSPVARPRSDVRGPDPDDEHGVTRATVVGTWDVPA
ncbi:hypothetical protein [Natronorubrum bangense]|nr:hypothetical protein [Natronorubrum bangense]